MSPVDSHQQRLVSHFKTISQHSQQRHWISSSAHLFPDLTPFWSWSNILKTIAWSKLNLTLQCCDQCQSMPMLQIRKGMFDVISLDFLTIMQKNRNHGDFDVLPLKQIKQVSRTWTVLWSYFCFAKFGSPRNYGSIFSSTVVFTNIPYICTFAKLSKRFWV